MPAIKESLKEFSTHEHVLTEVTYQSDFVSHSVTTHQFVVALVVSDACHVTVSCDTVCVCACVCVL